MVGLLAFVLLPADGAAVVIVVILAILLVVFWISQLLSLMNMRDEQFAGRHDKVLWFIVVFFGTLLGAFVFWLWKVRKYLERERARAAGGEASPAARQEAEDVREGDAGSA